MDAAALAESLRRRLAARGLRPDPVILCNKSHSGSRLLARQLGAAGLFLGAHRNASEDAWDWLPPTRHLVMSGFPAYAEQLAGRDPLLPGMVAAALERHLEGCPPGRRWGWKLCESGLALPVWLALFPEAQVVHLIRDGRDVAFSDHTGPTDAFWRTVFFGRSDVTRWQGRRLDGPSYRRAPHLFNAQHWAHAVAAIRRFGEAAGPRYRELRYEELCLRPADSLPPLLAWLGLSEGLEPALAVPVEAAAIGKHRRRSVRKNRAIRPLIEPLQRTLGYE